VGVLEHCAGNKSVPVYRVLARILGLSSQELEQWNAIIGLRNRILQDYMNLDMRRVLQVVESGGYTFVVDFLLASLEETGK
jgi:uncharacterized protein YutE (UPF0331/DUF86 family)